MTRFRASRPLKIAAWTAGALLLAILLVIAAVAVFLATFDWNHARPYINHRVSASTGRDFAIQGDLKVEFLRGLPTEGGWRRWVPRPHVVANDMHISNPSWSSVGPQMASAGQVDATMQLLPLLHKAVVLTDLALRAPSVALERRADGVNSWTLQDKGPSAWDVDLQRLAFAQGTLRYLDHGIGLDLRAEASSIAAADGATGDRYGLRFTLGGSYRKAPVTGGGKAGAVLSLQDQHTVYPIEAHAELGENSIAVAGTLTDPRSPSAIDLQLSLGGASMANLYPLTGVLLPETPPYKTRGRLLGKQDGGLWNWTYEKFTGQVGGSDLAGTLQYTPRKPRPLLHGSVTSQQLRLDDLGPTIGADSNANKQARGKAPVQPAGKALPVEQFNTAKWGALDADVKFSGKKLLRTHEIPLQDIAAEIHMKNKVLSLTPLNFGMAGGDVTSNVSLDGRQPQIAAQIKLAARHLQVRELFPGLQSMRASFGEVNGDAALTGHGNSVSAMLASSNGELGAVVSNGSISHFILEAAGLNIANAVFVKLFGDKQMHLNCMVSDFAVKNGNAEVRRFVLDTPDAVVDITGNIDLAKEALNLDVRPKTKGLRIISLRTPLYAKGTFEHPDVGPYKGPLALKAGAAAALTAASPLAAVLPLVNMGNTPDTDCAAALAQVTQTRSHPDAPAVAAPAKPVSDGDRQRGRPAR